MPSYSLILPAAGSGNRSGLNYNKILHPLNGKRIIDHSLSLFLNDPDCREILVMIRPDDRSDLEDLEKLEKVSLLFGGDTRQDSVRNGLLKASQDLVLIHDAARPFLRKEELEALKRTMETEDAAILAVPVRDTLKKSVNGKLVTVDREGLWAAQTPQAFQKSLLKRAFEKAEEENLQVTDEAGLFEALDLPVGLVMGHPSNRKITDPQDLEMI